MASIRIMHTGENRELHNVLNIWEPVLPATRLETKCLNSETKVSFTLIKLGLQMLRQLPRTLRYVLSLLIISSHHTSGQLICVFVHTRIPSHFELAGLAVSWGGWLAGVDCQSLSIPYSFAGRTQTVVAYSQIFCYGRIWVGSIPDNVEATG